MIKKSKNGILAIAILTTVLLMSSITILPMTSAHSPSLSIGTFAFINVAPNPVGVGQQVTVNFWLSLPPPTANGPYGDRWKNMTILITNPDGTTQTLGPFSSDDTGGTYTHFTPTQAGNYTFVFNFPGQVLSGDNPSPPAAINFLSAAGLAYLGDYFQPSVSSKYVLTVQQEPVAGVAIAPLPSNYWEPPVSSMNVNEWYKISGSWLGLGLSTFANGGSYNASGNYNPYTLAPQSPHILWTKPVAFGGALGGEFGGTETSNYYSTSQYEPKFAPIIINGVLYYQLYPGASTNSPGFAAVDLHTGKTLWTVNTTTTLRCGQILNYVTPNQYGGLAYLWTTGSPSGVPTAPGTGVMNMYDAMTGNYILSINNGPMASFLGGLLIAEDDGGNLIGYYVNSTSNTLNAWNSTLCISNGVGAAGQSSQMWRPPQNAVIDFKLGIQWSTPLPTNYSGNPLPFGGLQISATNIINSGVMVMVAAPSAGTSFFQPGWEIEAGYSTSTGSQLWITNRTETPYSRNTLLTSPVYGSYAGDGVYVNIDQTTMVATGYSLYTGEQLWTTALAPFNAYDTFGNSAVVANGTLYTWGLGGDVYAVNLHNGKILWQFTTGNSGSETPYGVWPLWVFSVGTVADGILYVPEGHMYSPPLFHGAQQLAINTTNGELVWGIHAFDTTSGPAISDGIMTTLNAYDNQIYAFGQGATKITVSAPSVGVTTSTPITISGTVTDISAGASQDAVAANFPNGLPCVSDASMTGFMEAVYEQQPMPNNTTGVPVVLSVMDSNGNYRAIGSTTSNALGTFSFTWTPDISGDYTVYASFQGSESYYASNAAAAFHASEPAATPTQAPTPPQSMADLYILPGIIAIIIAIIVVGAVTILALRKRP